MHGGKRINAGRPCLWTKKYPTSLVRIPENLKEALIWARREKIPVEQMVQSLQNINTGTLTDNGLFYK